MSLVEPLFDILGQRFRTVYQSIKIFSICFPSLTTSLNTRIFKNYGHLTEIYNGRVWTRSLKIFSEQNLHALEN